ncbi:MAG: cytochrome c oxidase subunit 3 [Pseudomonadota bacterium]
MAHGEVKHDYHLVEPSPWPLVGSVSAFVMAVGAVMLMNGELFGGGWHVLALGLLGIAYTMIGWWIDVVKESRAGDHTPVVQIGLRYGMMLFIASEVMFFVAWFWAYFGVALYPEAVPADSASDLVGQVIRQDFIGGHWPPDGIQTFDPWHIPLLNTLVLLLSGTTVTWAHHALLHNNQRGLIAGLTLTVVLGVFFSYLQYYEYEHAAFNYSGHIYGATFFMATGFHGAHVIIGTIFLAVCLLRASMGHFRREKHFGFEAAAWYWHFVDVVWLFLFAVIYVWGAGTPGH